MSTTLTTKFGAFIGKEVIESTVQYLGIKYASLRNHLSVPELVTDYSDGVVDATTFG